MRALGFPLGVYEKIFVNPGVLEKAKAQSEPLKYSTRYYFECKIARGLQMTMEQYRKLPRKERQLQYLFHVLEIEKENYAVEAQKKEMEQRRSDNKTSVPYR